MKAWVVHGFNDMRLTEVPIPSPVPAGWILVRVLTVQPSITETLLFQGLPTYNLGLVRKTLDAGPFQLFGHEYSAEVVEVGKGVEGLRPNMRVASRSVSSCGDCWLCKHGRRDECQKGPLTGFHYPGCFAQFALLPADTVVPLPDSISDSDGAALQPLSDSVAGVAAADIKLGDVLLVIGQGVMGLGAMQAARAAGAMTVVTCDVKDRALQLSRQLGADVAVDARRDDPVKVVQELTHGRGADVVIECAGGPKEQGLAGTATLSQAAAAVRDGGVVVGSALYGEGTFLPYTEFRHRSIRYVFPAPITNTLMAYVVSLVSSGRVRLDSTISVVLEGIERVPEAFELTSGKTDTTLINSAQVVIGKSALESEEKPLVVRAG